MGKWRRKAAVGEEVGPDQKSESGAGRMSLMHSGAHPIDTQLEWAL